MKVGETGEAFFVFETEADVPESLQTSPLSGPVSDDGNGDQGVSRSQVFWLRKKLTRLDTGHGTARPGCTCDGNERIVSGRSG